VFELGLDILITLLSISLLICFIRLYIGPGVPNRTVAFDLISIHAVGIFALLSVRYGTQVLLDGATVTAVLGFLGTVMLARYLENASTGKTEDMVQFDGREEAIQEEGPST
jgi:multisubunit Na+/H+ antiporter MnhF subunit